MSGEDEPRGLFAYDPRPGEPLDEGWEPPPDGSTIRLMGEYGADLPLWQPDGLMFADADEAVRELGLSPALARDLEAWGTAWDGREDPEVRDVEGDVADLDSVRKLVSASRVAIIGYDYYAAVAAAYAARHPQNVSRLLLLSPIEPSDSLSRAWNPTERMARLDTVAARALVKARAAGRDSSDATGYCESFWRVNARLFVGDTTRAAVVRPDWCRSSNESPARLADAAGRATVEATPTAARAASTPVSIQLIRPAGFGGGDAPQLVIGTGNSVIQWSGSEAPYVPPVTSPAPTSPGTTAPITPPPTIPDLPPTTGGAPSTTIPNIPAARPTLELTLDGDQTATVGGVARLGIRISNTGTAAATDVRVVDRFDPGLVYPQNRDARLMIRRLNICCQTPFEATAQALFQ